MVGIGGGVWNPKVLLSLDLENISILCDVSLATVPEGSARPYSLAPCVIVIKGYHIRLLSWLFNAQALPDSLAASQDHELLTCQNQKALENV